jgi:hypothetical protein
MSRKIWSLLAALGLVAVAVVVPTSGAGAGDGCVAWGTLPARATLAPHGVTVHTTLHGTAACAGVTADNGASALLRGPAGEHSVPMRWLAFGDHDQATFYPGLDRPGSYRLVDGKVQSYDAEYELIPATWRSTVMSVKYAGRFAGVSRTGSRVTATLQYYGAAGWRGHASVPVSLQQRTASGWHTLATTHASSSGRVHLAAHLSADGSYRLVSATSRDVWAASRQLGPSRL